VRAAEVPVPLPDEGELATFAKARAMGEVLAERLARARGGADLAEVVRPRATHDGDRPLAKAALAVWADVTEWLRRRLPVAIASLPDPSTALLRLRDDLASLETRLEHQETGLRGTSEDVARGIDVQLRRAKAQVRRLNQSLSGIRFGSIGGIRIQMAREPRMDQVLNALRDGTSQELLFDPRLAVEDALAEILKRYAGGRSGGQRVLDYREYLLLSVDIQRAGKSDWEQASPAKLSTGEGIGVGAAILMVILTEWERDGNLLRTRRPIGSMRFLFLDEANRLSQDNLATLFDLCQSLDLQLLVAAPEVARAEGATTYRLVRRTDDAGREEVVVSGRRAMREGSEAVERDEPQSDGPSAHEEEGARSDDEASPTLFD
jgi:chromosome partition protein MukB